MKRATGKLFEKGDYLGIKRRGPKPSSRESLPSPAKTDTAAVAVEKKAKEEGSQLKTEDQTQALL